MAVEVNLYNANYPTDESIAAQALEKLFREEFESWNGVEGTIAIVPSVQIYGYNVRDIDIVVMGRFRDLRYTNIHTKQGEGKNLRIDSFLVNIELKSMPSNWVQKSGTVYKVHYNDTGWHNASRQCEDAKYALRNSIKDQYGHDPYIVNLLWFRSVSKYELSEIRGNTLDNALPYIFSAKEFFEIVAQLSSINGQNESILNAFGRDVCVKESFDEIASLLTEIKAPKGLTKKKFEIISSVTGQLEDQVQAIMDCAGDRLNVLEGRVGTGKTILLLQAAYQLVSKNKKRCKLLTYNHALVSDIRRLIYYTKIPEGVDKQTLSISTFDSFFQVNMIEFGVLKESIDPNSGNYSTQYRKALEEFRQKLANYCQKYKVRSIKDSNREIDWDYILIDEAQDVSDLEKEIFYMLYAPKRIIIADGVDQFVKSNVRQNWSVGLDASQVYQGDVMTIERRQKANIVRFINALAIRSKIDWKVEENNNLPGGCIRVERFYTSDIHKELLQNCENNECENYDILILEPPSMGVRGDDNIVRFRNADAYKKANINVFDGFNSKNRSLYPSNNECRLFQYDSCRGLEGWCVVCDHLDVLVAYKSDTYNNITSDSLLSEEEQRKRFALLWALMPLTRAVDTLVITLKNPESELGKLLRGLCDDFSDFALWNINN